MTSATLALTRAVIASLSGDPTLSARVTGVFDAPPPGAKLPYVTVGADAGADWSTKSTPGREHRLHITAWDVPLASARCADLMAAIEATVSAIGAALDGHRLISMRFARSTLGVEAPGGPTRGTIEFRARTSVSG